MKANGATLSSNIANSQYTAGLIRTNLIQVLTTKSTQRLEEAKYALKLAEMGLMNGIASVKDVQVAQAAVQAASIPVDYTKLTTTQLLSLGFKELGASILAATKAIIAFLFTNPVGWFVLAIGAIAGGVAIFNHFHKTTEELREELSELKSELSDIQSELDAVNQEFETIQERIAELIAMPSLSFVQQEELNKLKEASAELQRQKKLLKSEEERTEKRVDAKAAETVDSQLKDKSFDGKWYDVALNALKNGLGGAGAGFAIGGPWGALAGGLAGIGTGIWKEIADNQISTEDKLKRELESYDDLIAEKERIEKALTTPSIIPRRKGVS
jgi:Skp family chaperone for outer membrane proteins